MNFDIGDVVQLPYGASVWEIINVRLKPSPASGIHYRSYELELIAGNYPTRHIEQYGSRLKKLNGMEALAWVTRLGPVETDYF